MVRPLRARGFLGVLLVSAAVLMLEIVLTRVFSVLLLYHFAFLIVSLALLGSGAAGVWLFLLGGRLEPAHTPRYLTGFAGLFGVAVVAASFLFVGIPFDPGFEGPLDWTDVGWISVTYILWGVPFFFAGACLALAISRYRQQISVVYSFDLMGAGLGCVGSIAALSWMGGQAVLGPAALAGAAAMLFGMEAGWGRFRIGGGISGLALVGIVAGSSAGNWLDVRPRTGYDADRALLYEEWNSYSRVSVYEDPFFLQPFGWGLSPTYVGPDPGHRLLLIDAKAGTPIQYFDGRWETVDFLRYDLTSLPYTILDSPSVFVMGVGGGRDVLTGLLYGASFVRGVELNPLIVQAMLGPFAEYSGQIYRHPKVGIVVDDARAYLAGSSERFDLIQASVTDTFAASSSGAFALAENGLYTREAFQTYYSHLTESGMVNFSRWYSFNQPVEALRMVSLALDGWEASGVDDPRQHLVVVAQTAPLHQAGSGLVSTLLKRSPFTASQVTTLMETSAMLEFEVLYAPGYSGANPVSDLIMAPDRARFMREWSFDLSAPTDDRPFFFSFVRAVDLLDPAARDSDYRISAHGMLLVLGALGLSVALGAAFLIGPLLFHRRRADSAGPPLRPLVYFAALGLGFIMLEIPLVQRLTLYLGHVVYALAVVLFSLLLFSGLGSLLTQRVSPDESPRSLRRSLVWVIVIGLAYVVVLPSVLSATQAWPLTARLALVLGALAPAGLVMGRPFPLGLKWAQSKSLESVPWWWAVNSAMSVVGSVVAVLVALHWGFSWAFLGATGSYALAFGVAQGKWWRAPGPAALH